MGAGAAKYLPDLNFRCSAIGYRDPPSGFAIPTAEDNTVLRTFGRLSTVSEMVAHLTAAALRGSMTEGSSLMALETVVSVASHSSLNPASAGRGTTELGTASLPE